MFLRNSFVFSKMDPTPRARERLRDRGLPQTAQYVDAELRRMQLEEERKMARRNVSGPRRPGGMPRAEADEVVAQIERSADGKFAGRLAGAVATTLAPKRVFSDKQQRNVENHLSLEQFGPQI